jgi:hypothetical protein
MGGRVSTFLNVLIALIVDRSAHEKWVDTDTVAICQIRAPEATVIHTARLKFRGAILSTKDRAKKIARIACPCALYPQRAVCAIVGVCTAAVAAAHLVSEFVQPGHDAHRRGFVAAPEKRHQLKYELVHSHQYALTKPSLVQLHRCLILPHRVVHAVEELFAPQVQKLIGAHFARVAKRYIVRVAAAVPKRTCAGVRCRLED